MKNILKILLERDYGISSLNININKLLEFSDEQLLVLLNNGVNISEDLVLNYAPGIGFRCWNNNVYIKGKLPIAGVIERKLNSNLKANIEKLNS